MKKLIALLVSVAFIFCVSCSNSNESTSDNQTSAIDYSTMEVVRWEADGLFCYDYEQLEELSDIAVIGTFTQDSTTECIMNYDEAFGKDVLTFIYSYNKIKVEKVLKGNVNVGDEITAIQACGIHNDKLVTFSDMEPMAKGDQWIFFLIYDETYGGYWCTSDYSSRFPVPSGQSATLSRSVNANTEAQLVSEIEKMTHEDFGVYSDVAPMKDLYYDVITHYDCTLQ